MSKVGFVLVAILAVGLGLLVGSLNSDHVTLDLLWIQLNWPLGLLVLFSMAAGLLLGLILSLVFQVVPLKIRLKKASDRENDVAGGRLVETDD